MIKEGGFFFRRFLGETACFIDELRGKPLKKLSELDQEPDHILREMVPLKSHSDHYRFQDNVLLIKERENGKFQEVMELELSEMEILEFFDSDYNYNLEEITDLLGNDSNQYLEDTFQRVKNLFIKLAKHGIYLPSEPEGIT